MNDEESIPWVFILTMACGTEPPEVNPDAVVRDSAGVRVATYGSLMDWGDGPVVTEILRIGEIDGPDEMLFSSLAGGFILPDGGVVLADATSREVRQFNSSGDFVRKHGQEGEGPGEYQYIIGMGKCRPDGFTVFDIGWTMSFYDDEGRFVEEQVTRLEGGSTPYHMACQRSGVLAVINWDLGGPQLGFHTAMGRLRILNSDGSEAADLGDRIGFERWGHRGGSGPHPAGRSTRFGFSGGDLIVADGSFFGFERWSQDGVLQEVVRLEAAPPSIDSLMSEYLEWSLSRASNDEMKAGYRRDIESMEGPAQASFFSDLFVSDRLILVREPSVGESGRWFGFQADGHRRAMCHSLRGPSSWIRGRSTCSFKRSASLMSRLRFSTESTGR